MNGWDQDGADSHCVGCGAPIYFDVGWSSERCPACGREDCMKTDAEIRIKREEQDRVVAKITSGDYYRDRLDSIVEGAITDAKFMLLEGKLPPDVVLRARKMIAVLKTLRKV